MVVAALTSDIRRGRADTTPFSSSLTKPSSSCSSANQIVLFLFQRLFAFVLDWKKFSFRFLICLHAPRVSMLSSADSLRGLVKFDRTYGYLWLHRD